MTHGTHRGSTAPRPGFANDFFIFLPREFILALIAVFVEIG